jgi:hypothetical protein
VRSDSRGALRRRAAALTAAFGAAAASAVLIGGCSSPADVLTQKVLLTSGTYDDVWWGLWAWTDKGELCMAMAGTGGPDAANAPASDPSGGQCGFKQGQPEPGYIDSGIGPAGSYYSTGPLPLAATQVRVATRLILPASAFPSGVGLPSGHYWVEIGPGKSEPPMASEGTYLKTPQPLNASGKPIPFEAF